MYQDREYRLQRFKPLLKVMTKYALTGRFRGSQDYYAEITEEQFHQIKIARANLFRILSIEDKFNLVLENYAEFEQELLNSSVNEMLFQDNDWLSRMDKFHLINRRLINLLTTFRLYTDQIFHDIHSIYGKNSQQKETIEKQTNLEYDSETKPGYRVMAAIRNYVQHRELAIHSVGHPAYDVNLDERFQVTSKKYTIQVNINIKSLEENGFKKKIVDELKKYGDSVNIIPLIRQCLDSIGEIRSKVRDLIKFDVSDWDETIQENIKQYSDFTGFSDGLSLVKLDNLDTMLESYLIFGHFIKRRQFLENKNKYITNYSNRFISSEA